MPAAGNVAVLTNGNGKLANTFRSQAAPYYTEFHAAKIANSYGGAGCKNPYWGQWGCTMVFSGGHANTNDNSVFIVEYQQDRIEFKRITDPVPWFGTGTDSDTRFKNAYSNLNSAGPGGTPLLDWIEGSQATNHNLRYGEAVNLTGAAAAWNGQPGASHTYGIPVIIGPESGGAVHGTYLKAQNPAVGAANWQGCFAAHALHLTSTTAAPSTRRWVRHTQRRRDEGSARYRAPCLAQYVPTHNRIYMVHRNNWLGTFWYDVGAADWVDGTGVPFDFHRADSTGAGTPPIDADLTPKAYQAETGTLMYVPERNLLVCAFRLGGELWVQWMDVSVPQPTLGGRAALSQRLSMTNFTWGAGTWCPDNNRIVVAGVNGDRDAAYEIEIPADLNATWTVTRAPYGNGVQFYPNSDTTYHKFQYDWAVRSIVYFPSAAAEGDDTVFVYRPRGT